MEGANENKINRRMLVFSIRIFVRITGRELVHMSSDITGLYVI